MAKYRITAPDGNTYEITAPDDATQEQVLAYAQQNHGPAVSGKVRAPTPERVPKGPDPAEGMSGLDRIRAGFAQSFVNTGEGIKQLATEGLRNLAGGAFDSALPEGKRVDNPVTRWADRSLAEQQKIIDERRRMDAPLDRTTAGKVGNIAGNLTQILGPGIALRGTMAGRALLPTTIGGNALQGATIGAIQPTATGESRTANAAFGGTIGAVVPAAMKAPGAVRRAVVDAVRPERAASKQAARLVQKEAAAPNVGMLANPSAVPGATRSLFEETLDPGIARLETRSRGNSNAWADRDSANNIARINALRSFAGDEADIAAAENARSLATNQLRNRAFAEGDTAIEQAAAAGFSAASNKAGLRTAFEGIAGEQGGRSAVKRTVQDVIADLDDAAPTVQGLYNVRKTIGDLLSGKAGADKAHAKAASAELIQMRDLLDAELMNLSPSFGDYLGAFRSMSSPINRMQTGQELIARGTGGLDPVTGEARLMPGQFGRAARDLDAVAQSATGFGKAQASDILQPGDIAAINAVNEDLARQAARLVRGAGGGSHTASQQEVGKRIAVRSLARAIPGVGAAVEFLEAQSAQRLEKALERILANPKEYRAIAALVSREDRRLLDGALARIAGTGANVSGPALDRRQPVPAIEGAALAE